MTVSGTLYNDLMDIINMHKAKPRTEVDTESFCENLMNLMDKHYLKGNLTTEQYEILCAALPK